MITVTLTANVPVKLDVALGENVQPAPPPVAATEPPPTISHGDYGSAVMYVQECLAVTPVDSDFGPITTTAVKQYQSGNHLTPDGVVGPQTWGALQEEFSLPPYPTPFLEPLPDDVIVEIQAAVEASPIIRRSWRDRGVAPIGYYHGLALSYATVVRKYQMGNGTAHEIAKADTGDTATDALAYYRTEFRAIGLDNSQPGPGTLRHVFVFLMGLGMRESSGKYCCGRDQSASNVQSDTCEAGLFQTSWNYHVCCTDAEWLLDEYRPGLGEGPSPPQCNLAAFQMGGVTCSAADWQNYGSGDGRDFQALSKECPAFAVESAAIGIRNIRKHWGPIGRKEVEVIDAADTFFKQIDAILAEAVA